MRAPPFTYPATLTMSLVDPAVSERRHGHSVPVGVLYGGPSVGAVVRNKDPHLF